MPQVEWLIPVIGHLPCGRENQLTVGQPFIEVRSILNKFGIAVSVFSVGNVLADEITK
jgi:hypothetical protein